MNALHDRLNVQPATPQGLPARWAIAFASEIASIAGNGIPTLLARHRVGIALIQRGHHLHDVGWQDLARSPLRLLRDTARSCNKRTATGASKPKRSASPHSPECGAARSGSQF